MQQGANGALEPGTHRLLERMLFFSDAVFAIVLTLLVLDPSPASRSGRGSNRLTDHPQGRECNE